jgi:hypothetical protein
MGRKKKQGDSDSEKARSEAGPSTNAGNKHCSKENGPGDEKKTGQGKPNDESVPASIPLSDAAREMGFLYDRFRWAVKKARFTVEPPSGGRRKKGIAMARRDYEAAKLFYKLGVEDGMKSAAGLLPVQSEGDDPPPVETNHLPFVLELLREYSTLLADHHRCTDDSISATSGKNRAGREHEQVVPPEAARIVRKTPKNATNLFYHWDLRQNRGGDQRGVSNIRGLREMSRSNSASWSVASWAIRIAELSAEGGKNRYFRR